MQDYRTLQNITTTLKKTSFEKHKIDAQKNGYNSISSLGIKIWAQVPSHYKESTSLAILENNIKNWNLAYYPSKLYHR